MKRRVLGRATGPVRSFLARHPRSEAIVAAASQRIPGLQEALLWVARADPREQYERWVWEYDTLDEADLAGIRRAQARLRDPPLLSLIVPMTSSDRETVEALAARVCVQTYEHWELWLVGAQPAQSIEESRPSPLLDPRCRWISPGQGSTAEGVNAALESAAGGFAVLVDPQVALRPHSLYLLAQAIEHDPDAALVYGDEDAIDENGVRSDHYFKPDWNERLFRCQNYFGGLVAFRRSFALVSGGCREEPDGDFAWGLFLRLTAVVPPGSIRHLPFVLTHRRRAEREAATDGERRGIAAGALELRLAELGQDVLVEQVGQESFRMRYPVPETPPSVSLIVPSTGKLELLRPCLHGLLQRTSYPEFEVLVVVNGGLECERREYLEAVQRTSGVRVLVHDEERFNFARTNNWAVEQAAGELLCFVNDDTEVLDNGWLSTLVAEVACDRVAAAGPLLLYPNGRIQHAGVVLGAGGVAAHNYGRWHGGTSGYHERALVEQDVSCVTAACMLVRLKAFAELGGFDESLAVAFNDVDLCLRMTAAGWRIVWTPLARLTHRESASIGRHDAGSRAGEWNAAFELMQERWGGRLTSDPHYSPNLSLDPRELWQPAFPPRVTYAWRAESPAKEKIRAA